LKAKAQGVKSHPLSFDLSCYTPSSPLALEYLAGETGVITLVATALSAGVILYRLRQRRGTVAVRLPAGM